MKRHERIKLVTTAYTAIQEIETEKDLRKQKLTLTEYHAIAENLRAFGNCKPDDRTETIYKGIAEFFTRYGFTVKQHGIGFQITF
jgi:hypothetical protein